MSLLLVIIGLLFLRSLLVIARSPVCQIPGDVECAIGWSGMVSKLAPSLPTKGDAKQSMLAVIEQSTYYSTARTDRQIRPVQESLEEE